MGAWDSLEVNVVSLVGIALSLAVLLCTWANVSREKHSFSHIIHFIRFGKQALNAPSKRHHQDREPKPNLAEMSFTTKQKFMFSKPALSGWFSADFGSERRSSITGTRSNIPDAPISPELFTCDSEELSRAKKGMGSFRKGSTQDLDEDSKPKRVKTGSCHEEDVINRIRTNSFNEMVPDDPSATSPAAGSIGSPTAPSVNPLIGRRRSTSTSRGSFRVSVDKTRPSVPGFEEKLEEEDDERSRSGSAAATAIVVVETRKKLRRKSVSLSAKSPSFVSDGKRDFMQATDEKDLASPSSSVPKSPSKLSFRSMLRRKELTKQTSSASSNGPPKPITKAEAFTAVQNRVVVFSCVLALISELDPNGNRNVLGFPLFISICLFQMSLIFSILTFWCFSWIIVMIEFDQLNDTRLSKFIWYFSYPTVVLVNMGLSIAVAILFKLEAAGKEYLYTTAALSIDWMISMIIYCIVCTWMTRKSVSFLRSNKKVNEKNIERLSRKMIFANISFTLAFLVAVLPLIFQIPGVSQMNLVRSDWYFYFLLLCLPLGWLCILGFNWIWKLEKKSSKQGSDSSARNKEISSRAKEVSSRAKEVSSRAKELSSKSKEVSKQKPVEIV